MLVFLVPVETQCSTIHLSLICSANLVMMTFSYMKPASPFTQSWCKTAHMQCIHGWVTNEVVAGVDGNENASVWDETSRNGRLWQELYVFFRICSHLVHFHRLSVRVQEKQFFSVHTTMRVVMKQQRRLTDTVLTVNGWGCAHWLPPQESVIIFGWVALTVTRGLIVAGCSPLCPADPPLGTNKPQLKVKSGHLRL